MKFLHTQPYRNLTTLGAVEKPWPDYVQQYEFNDTHIRRLTQLATHLPYLWANELSDHYWLPIHAWRTLGQLKADAAVMPLLAHLDLLEQVSHHHAMEEIPVVLAQIGRASLRPVAVYLADVRHSLWARIVITATLAQFAKWHPELTEHAALIGATQLGNYATQSPIYNSLLVGELLDLKATQHIEVINAAFRADKVDLNGGDWQEAHIKLGLLDKRLTPAPPWQLVSNQSELLEWRQLEATAFEGEDTLSRVMREYARRERLGNVN